VRRHPGSGRNALYIASHASHIIGMPIEEGQALLRELIEFATQPRFVYRHKWRIGDLVIWDNRSTMHRATPFEATGHVRDMRRTTIIDTRIETADRDRESADTRSR
jgi:alpha-ketoglutarate-dependent 2,4-dichlorophenoxyacetate dioxygenase